MKNSNDPIGTRTGDLFLFQCLKQLRQRVPQDTEQLVVPLYRSNVFVGGPINDRPILQLFNARQNLSFCTTFTTIMSLQSSIFSNLPVEILPGMPLAFIPAHQLEPWRHTKWNNCKLQGFTRTCRVGCHHKEHHAVYLLRLYSLNYGLFN